MALTKAQLSLVSVATLGVAAGGYTAQLAAFGSQKEAAAFIATTGLLNEGTNAEFVNTVAKNLGTTVQAKDKIAFLKALEDGATRADAAVDFANAQLVQHGSIPNVDTAAKSTSTSTDLAELAEVVNPVNADLTIKFDTGTDGQDNDTVDNIGKKEIDAGAPKKSADYTFELKNQIGESASFNGKFLSPVLDRKAADSTGSQIVLELRNLREDNSSVEPLKGLKVDGIAFTLNGKILKVASEQIDAALTYEQLKTAIEARVAELVTGDPAKMPSGDDGESANPADYAGLATFTVTVGSDFTVTNDSGTDVSGKQIVLTDAAGQEIVPITTTDAPGLVVGTGFTLYGELKSNPADEVAKSISTNLDANNVGYGSQGATVNLAGQSASDKGVEEIKVLATNNVWFTTLKSEKATNHLQSIELKSGSNGYFRVGSQKNDDNHLKALVEEDFDNAGLKDVQVLNAGAAGSVAVNSYITDAVINRFDLKDTGLFNKDDTDALIQYNLTSGSDVLQLKIDSEVVAYADAVVNINAGAGNDFVHLQIDQGNTYGTTWLTNQQLNDNINIKATGGNNIIWTEGAGNANIETGSGADTIYTDNSGKQTVSGISALKLADLGYGDKMNALFALNAASADLSDIVSNTDNGLDNNGTNTLQVYNTFKNTVSVSFKGFETKHETIESTKYTTSTQQVNQAIKKAILEDATLSKLLTVKEFPGNVLVVESLIDGEMNLSDLSFDFVAPADNGTAATLLTKGQLVLGANELKEAGKAYADPGTANPPAVTNAAVLGTNFADLNTIYNTNKAFVTEGPGSTAEVQEIDFNSVTTAPLAVGEAGTIQVGSVNIALETGDDANDIASKVAAQLNGKMQFADLGVALVGTPTAADAAVTATASNGVVTITYATTAGDVALVGNTASVAPSTAAAALAISAAETAAGDTASSPAVAEVQTISKAQIEAFRDAVTKGSVTMVIGKQEVVINATDTADQIGKKLAGALHGKQAQAELGLTPGAADGAVSAIYTDGVNLVVTFDIGSGTMTDLTTTTPVVSGTQATNIVGIASSLVTDGAIVDTDIDGIDSTAHSDNVVDAGTGNDVIVLGTDDESNDTVVLSGNFGKTTIVNFDSTTAAVDTAGDGGDLLDFTAYLNSNYGADDLANVTLDNDGTLDNGNTVSVIDFSTLQSGNADGFAITDALTAAVNTTKLAFELKADFKAGTDTATKHVFLIHNKTTTALDNEGEYLVVTANSTAATADLSDVKVVGTLDFGVAQTFAEGNFVDFA